MITNNLHIKTEFTVVPEFKHCDWIHCAIFIVWDLAAYENTTDEA